MNLINLTPHDITIDNGTDLAIVIKPTSPPARIVQYLMSDIILPNFEIKKISYGPTEGLPDEVDDVFYIVSQMVARANPHRYDLVFPAEVQRDDQGRVTCCKSLARF